MTRNLPFSAAFRHAVSSLADNLATAVKMSWPWYTIIIPLSLAVYALLALATGGKPDSRPVLTFFATLLVAALTLLSASSIAVNWHCYILRDEVPRGSENLRLDERVWRYFGNTLAIMLAVLAVLAILAIPLSTIAAFAGLPALGVAATFVIGVPVAGTLFLRLAVKLPAIALGRGDFLFRDAWQATGGNNLPIFFLFVLNMLVGAGAITAVVAIEAALSIFGATIGTIMGIIAEVAANWILTIFGITVLTSLYGFFVEDRDF